MDVLRVPCLIIGLGAGGLVSGINFLENYESKNGNDCLIVGKIGSNSAISPWNIMIREPEEIRDKILKAGNNMSDSEVLDSFVSNYDKIIPFLEKMGIPLRDSNLGKVPVIKGSECIAKLLSNFENLGGKVIQSEVQSLISCDGRVCGVIIKDDSGEKEIIADQVIIASGGLVNLYKYTTGFNSRMPNIISLANYAGLEVEDLEFNMFHPFLITDKNLPRVLVSGELLWKAKYVDEEGNEFLSEDIKNALRNNDYHGKFPLMIREFYLQSLKSKIYMDISENSDGYFEKYKAENEFGWVFKGKSLEEIKKFEIHPAFHFSIGGIKINKNAETNQSGVYAVGEVACGLYGSNRIGGFAISECIVFGIIAGKIAASKAKMPEFENVEVINNSRISEELKKNVWNVLGPVKKTSDLINLKEELGSKESLSCEESLVLKMVNVSLLRDSIGTHFKND